mgnify:FL=1
MEQKDYLLREIEKIGLLLRAILNKLKLSVDNGAITLENQFDQEKELLLNEIGFNIDEFASLNDSEIEQYLSKFEGIRGINLELLADVLREAGFKAENNMTNAYFEKSLKLYELCNSWDKTYSFERESKIKELRNILY